jgi:inner membrane protein involved in colicin E2 resistance
MKAALEEKRREFFQLTANEFDFKTIKQEGRAKMLKQIADDCKFDEEVVPNLLKVKFDIAKDNEMREREMQAKEKQAENGNAAVQAAQVQASTTEKIAASNAEIKKADLSLKAQKQDNELRVKAEELQLEREKTATKAMAEVQGKQVTADAMKDVTRTKVAADIAKGQAAQNT